jgi:hypothetical protein
MADEWAVYDYVDHRDKNLIEKWLEGLQVPERARMLRKLDALRKNGPDLSSELLSDTPYPHIKKMRLNGRVAPRLLLCRGPVNMGAQEFTLLFGCTERDRKFVPSTALATAEEHRQYVIADPQKRRTKRVFEEPPEASTEGQAV